MSTCGDEIETEAGSKRNVRTHSERAATASLLILAAMAEGGQALLSRLRCQPGQKTQEARLSLVRCLLNVGMSLQSPVANESDAIPAMVMPLEPLPLVGTTSAPGLCKA